VSTSQPEEKAGPPIDATAGRPGAPGPPGSTSPSRETHPRSDPRRRRIWLAQLDPILGEEIRQAGAVSCEELAALAERPLKATAGAATIEEWWEYAYRRSWIEEHTPGRCRLTDVGREGLARLRRSNAGTDPAELAKGLLKWIAPTGAVLATAYASSRHDGALAAILLIGMAVAVLLFIAAPLVKLLDGPLDRLIARRACRWLEDRELRFARRAPVGRRADRVYGPGQSTATGLGLPMAPEERSCR